MKGWQMREINGSYVDYVLMLQYLSGPVLPRRARRR